MIPAAALGADPESVIVTSDLSEARDHITRIYRPHTLESRDGRPLDFRLRYVQSSRLTVGHLRYGADVQLVVPPMRSCYHLNLTLAGRTAVHQSGTRVTTSAGASGVVFDPHEAFTVRWSPEAVQYGLKVPRVSIESHLAALLGRPVENPISFRLGFDLTTPCGQGLLSAVNYLRAELMRKDGMADLPLLRSQLESYVLTSVLLCVPNDYTHLLCTPAPAPGRTCIVRVLDYISAHPGDPLTTAELARVAGVSARALQDGFQKDVGMSPMAYVRDVRLDRVHADLLATPTEVSITDLATRWGFFHLSRFAEYYKRKFGVLPSVTLKRALAEHRAEGAARLRLVSGARPQSG